MIITESVVYVKRNNSMAVFPDMTDLWSEEVLKHIYVMVLMQ
jgi:hypothetical protein